MRQIQELWRVKYIQLIFKGINSLTFLVLSSVYYYYCCFILFDNLLDSKKSMTSSSSTNKGSQSPSISTNSNCKPDFKSNPILNSTLNPISTSCSLMTTWLLIIMLFLVKVLEGSLKKILTSVVLRSPPSCKIGQVPSRSGQLCYEFQNQGDLEATLTWVSNFCLPFSQGHLLNYLISNISLIL